MKSFSKRLARLEQARQARSTWTLKLVEAQDFEDDAAIDQELARLEAEALAAGWQPGAHPFAVVVYCSTDEPEEPESD